MKPPQLPDKNESKQAGMSIAKATILKGKSRDVGPIAVLLADQKKSTQVRAIFNSYGIWRFGVGCVLTPDETQVLYSAGDRRSGSPVKSPTLVWEEWSTLTCRWCPRIQFRLSVVSYLVATPIWSYRLRRTTDRAWSSVANADAPLAYELAATLAFRRNLHVPPAYEVGIRTVRKSLVSVFLAVLTQGDVGCYINVAIRRYRVQIHRFNKRPASRIRHSAGSNQEYQSLSGSAISLRLLALKVRPRHRSVWDQGHGWDNGSDVVLL